MTPTVMIPGTLCDASVFDEVVARLPDHRVRVADVTGHAHVGPAAAEVLDTIEGRFLCVGFSLGGFVALEILRRAPERLLGVVLVAGNAHPDRPEMASVRRAQAAFARTDGMDALVRGSIADWGLADLPDVAERVSTMARAVGGHVLARQAEMNLSRPDYRTVVERASVPVLVVAGERDPLCPPDRYAAAAAGHSGRLVVLAGRGHYLPIEAPAEVAAAIAAMELAA